MSSGRVSVGVLAGKARLQALKQKMPLEPKAVAKKGWTAGNYPELAKETPSTTESKLEVQHW